MEVDVDPAEIEAEIRYVQTLSRPENLIAGVIAACRPKRRFCRLS
jgi:predicted TIM-barrel fold metal-dependent hydrolase